MAWSHIGLSGAPQIAGSPRQTPPLAQLSSHRGGYGLGLLTPLLSALDPTVDQEGLVLPGGRA